MSNLLSGAVQIAILRSPCIQIA